MGRCHLYGLEQSIWYTARWKLLVQAEKVRIKIRICKVVKELAKREVTMGWAEKKKITGKVSKESVSILFTSLTILTQKNA